MCSALNGQLLTDNCRYKKSADQHNIKNCGLSCAACMYACKRFHAWHPFDSQLTDVKERNPLTRRTLSTAISRVKHIKDKCFFWKVDSWPVKSSPLNRGLKFHFLRRGVYWLGAHYISQADILFCSSILILFERQLKKESFSHYHVAHCGFRLLSHHSRFCKVLAIAGPKLI